MKAEESPEDYLDITRPYSRDMINNHKALIELKDPNDKINEGGLFGEQEFQSTMQITFIFSLDTGEIRTTDSKRDNVEIEKGSEADDIIKILFESFKKILRRIRNKNERESICLKCCFIGLQSS